MRSAKIVKNTVKLKARIVHCKRMKNVASWHDPSSVCYQIIAIYDSECKSTSNCSETKGKYNWNKSGMCAQIYNPYIQYIYFHLDACTCSICMHLQYTCSACSMRIYQYWIAIPNVEDAILQRISLHEQHVCRFATRCVCRSYKYDAEISVTCQNNIIWI